MAEIPIHIPRQISRHDNKTGKKKSKKVESHFLPLFHRNFQLFNNFSTRFSTSAEFSTKKRLIFGLALSIGKNMDNVESSSFQHFAKKFVAKSANSAGCARNIITNLRLNMI